jgi:hypothetical protein
MRYKTYYIILFFIDSIVLLFYDEKYYSWIYTITISSDNFVRNGCVQNLVIA